MKFSATHQDQDPVQRAPHPKNLVPERGLPPGPSHKARATLAAFLLLKFLPQHNEVVTSSFTDEETKPSGSDVI